MKFIVHAVKSEIISIEVEADSAAEAIESASEAGRHEWDVWDDEISYGPVVPQ